MSTATENRLAAALAALRAQEAVDAHCVACEFCSEGEAPEACGQGGFELADRARLMRRAALEGETVPVRRDLTFNPEGGKLAIMLGCDPKRLPEIEQAVRSLVEQRKSSAEIITAMNERGDLTDAEWTAFVFGLGNLDARVHGC